MLAARLLGRLARLQSDAVLAPLVQLLADESTAVASAASASLLSVSAAQPDNLTLLLAQRGLPSVCNSNATVRLRVLALASQLAGSSADASSAIASSGLSFEALLAPLNSGDLLSALASLEVLAQIVESDEAALGSAAVPALLRLVDDTEADVLLRSRALSVCARIAAAQKASPDFLRAVFDAMQDDSPLRAAAVEAVGALGQSVCGAEAALQHKVVAPVACAAFGGGGAAATAATHALATLCGAERPVGAELFSNEAEAALADVVRAGLAVARGAPSLAEALFAPLQRRGAAFIEERVAVYRLVSALGRRRWAATAVCAHAALLDALISGDEESGHRPQLWRVAALGALASALRGAENEFPALCARLNAAVAAGPFASERGVRAPQVALQL